LLRIDLLPEHFAQARAAKAWMVFMAILLAVAVLGCFGFFAMEKSALASVQADYAKWDADAKKVEATEAKAKELEDLAAPIGAKVSFIEEADKSGEQFWNAFDKVNRYIYAKAQMKSFSITPPSSVSFDVELPDTTSVGRFVLNLIRCPDITSISFGGSVPAGQGVGPGAGAAPAAGGAGGPGMPGMAGAPGGMPGMPGGMPGGAPGGMPGGMPAGGPGGMPGMGAPAPSAGGAPAGGPIHLTVTAQLTKPITVPALAGGAAAGPGGPGMPGMPGAPGTGPPGAGPPGAGPAGGVPKAGSRAKAGGGGEDSGGGGGGLKSKKGGGGEDS
jgi:hypothetical protein